jgi:uncharacterized repeat protein (TIGR03803 family)
MRVIVFFLCGLIFCGVSVAGCSSTTGGSSLLPADLLGGTPNVDALEPSKAAIALERQTGSGFRTLYSFKGGADGDSPGAGLAVLNATLYGTTVGGGAKRPQNGGGTVFELTTAGGGSVIHRFNRGSLRMRNGATPEANLIARGEKLYGTTSAGGAHDLGAVFDMTTSGEETVLYSFGSFTGDGANPAAGLVTLSGKFYGSTTFGGADNDGVVFEVSSSGTERVLYSFKGGKNGSHPSGVVALNGNLYGTTAQGGDAGCQCGIVFELNLSGRERVLHRFTGGSDGSGPVAGLVAFNATLYGTTNYGGNPNCNFGNGCGTVFAVSASGKESVLHAFGAESGRADGVFPQAALTALDGVLYGTTKSCNEWGYGTVFRVSTTGKERVLYTFTGGSDGGHPSGLIALNGVLYGTTPIGGSNGYGSAFSVSR